MGRMGRLRGRIWGPDMRNYRAALFLPLLCLAALAQSTHIVQGGGNALQQAITAASPGDILDVQPAQYSPVTATRGLHLLLRAGTEVGMYRCNRLRCPTPT